MSVCLLHSPRMPPKEMSGKLLLGILYQENIEEDCRKSELTGGHLMKGGLIASKITLQVILFVFCKHNYVTGHLPLTFTFSHVLICLNVFIDHIVLGRQRTALWQFTQI